MSRMSREDMVRYKLSFSLSHAPTRGETRRARRERAGEGSYSPHRLRSRHSRRALHRALDSAHHDAMGRHPLSSRHLHRAARTAPTLLHLPRSLSQIPSVPPPSLGHPLMSVQPRKSSLTSRQRWTTRLFSSSTVAISLLKATSRTSTTRWHASNGSLARRG